MKRLTVKPTRVEITLNDGAVIEGMISVPVQGRISDTLNDPREFLPVETADGNFVALAKAAIRKVLLSNGETNAPYKGDDPYRILGVTESVSPGELKKAYYDLCAVNHPDRIRALGLSPEFEEVATKSMARINLAYAQLTKTPQRAD